MYFLIIGGLHFDRLYGNKRGTEKTWLRWSTQIQIAPCSRNCSTLWTGGATGEITVQRPVWLARVVHLTRQQRGPSSLGATHRSLHPGYRPRCHWSVHE